MIESMSIHMSDTQVANNFSAVLENVRRGVEIVVEQNHRPVAVIRAPVTQGRLLSECIALAKTRHTTAVLDKGFMEDVAAGITERSKPWNPPAWE